MNESRGSPSGPHPQDHGPPVSRIQWRWPLGSPRRRRQGSWCCLWSGDRRVPSLLPIAGRLCLQPRETRPHFHARLGWRHPVLPSRAGVHTTRPSSFALCPLPHGASASALPTPVQVPCATCLGPRTAVHRWLLLSEQTGLAAPFWPSRLRTPGRAAVRSPWERLPIQAQC